MGENQVSAGSAEGVDTEADIQHVGRRPITGHTSVTLVVERQEEVRRRWGEDREEMEEEMRRRRRRRGKGREEDHGIEDPSRK